MKIRFILLVTVVMVSLAFFGYRFAIENTSTNSTASTFQAKTFYYASSLNIFDANGRPQLGYPLSASYNALIDSVQLFYSQLFNIHKKEAAL